MPSAQRRLMIDATAQGPSGPLALAPLLGARVLDHHLALARRLGKGAVTIHVRPDDRAMFDVAPGEKRSITIVLEPPAADSAVLRVDRLYDPRRLVHCWQRGQDPERAVIWRLDSPDALAAAGDELLKRRDYQPLGRYWALAPARALARLLRQTAVRPDHLTWLAAAFMAGGAALLAVPDEKGIHGLLASLALALALVLDTADGHLARLQGTSSRRGRWLDATLDELADMALHAAVAWGAFLASGNPLWLAAGMLYAMGKYAFVVSNQISDDACQSSEEGSRPDPVRLHGIRALAHWMGHADVRWHAWIVLAACHLMPLELLLFAAYYPARGLAGAYRKWGTLSHA